VGKTDLAIPGLSDQSPRSCREHKPLSGIGGSVTRRAGIFQDESVHAHAERRRSERSPKKPLVVLKFGGTSVGDACCIRRVTEIIRAASRESNVAVVVSAMSGVTNKLLEAATSSETGNRSHVAAILEELRMRHSEAAEALIRSGTGRNRINRKVRTLFQEADALCQGTILLRELTLRARDAIASLGERLSARLVAAVLADSGLASEAIDATEVVVTNSCYGGAEPLVDLTRERCKTRVHPLIRQGTIPVVTGFIGATTEGIVTTLGRNGSDYSATILGAALDADEVIIWSDVDGVLTVDPRLVPGVRRIPEISYREAAELAYFGAKVLHPKTLRPLVQSGTPVWIRNTFAPERPGTKITRAGSSNGGAVKALTAIRDAALITVGGPGMLGVTDVLGRTFKATAAVQANVLLSSQSSSQNEICLVVSSALADRTVEALKREFALDLAHEKAEHVTLNPNVAIIALVGENMRSVSGIVGRTFGALDRGNINIIAIAQGSSACSISFVVPRNDMKATLIATHREFGLGAEFPASSDDLPVNMDASPESGMASEQTNEGNLTASAD
jgi:bifunctional aspartokinase / homoserine dehydrogenase 1